MKTTFITLLFSLITSINLVGQFTEICESFNGYNLGPISTQSPDWHIINGGDDAYVGLINEVSKALAINRNDLPTPSTYVEYIIPEDPESIVNVEFNYTPIFHPETGYGDAKYSIEFTDGTNIFIFASDYGLVHESNNTIRLQFNDLVFGGSLYDLYFNGTLIDQFVKDTNIKGVTFCGNAGTYFVHRVCYDVFESHLDCSNTIPIHCGETVSGDNFSGANNATTYCGTSPGLTGNEVVYEINTSSGGEYTFLLSDVPTSADLDMFLLYGDCDQTECIMASDGSNQFAADLMSATLNAFQTYYLVVDGDNNGGNTSDASSYRLSVNCNSNCQPRRPLQCDQPDDWGTFNEPSLFSFYECENTAFGYNVNLDGPEVYYDFTPTVSGDYTFSLSGVSFNQDLDIFILRECNPFSCISTTDDDFPSTSQEVTVHLDADVDYIVIIDGDNGSTSNYTLTVTGCHTDLCTLVFPQEENENHVIFDDSQLAQSSTEFTVRYPYGAETMEDYTYTATINVPEGENPEFECPFPGCYLICFKYLDNNNQLTECCIKYCSQFKYSECTFKPLVYDVENSNNTTTCRITCESLATRGSSITGDSSYVSIIGDGIDMTVQENDEVTLPNGQYEICCWVYDAECDFWDVCCDIYCFPYIYPSDRCNTPYFTKSTDDGNLYNYFSSGSGVSVTVTPSAGSTLQHFSNIYELRLTQPGVYQVCIEGGELEDCCQYVCWESTENNDCLDINYLDSETINLQCANDEYVYYWTILALCPQPPDIIVTCESWFLYGSSPTWSIPAYGGEFEICKYYNGCCGEIEVCCETICTDGFTPYDTEGGFNYCDEIFINNIYPLSDTESQGWFGYTGEGLGQEGGRWEIWSENENGYNLEKIGPLGPSLDMRTAWTDGYSFIPGTRYFVCYTWIGEDGCRQYCCIKVELSSNCSHLVNYTGVSGGLSFHYDYDELADETVQNWYVSGDNSSYDNDSGLDYNYPTTGTYYVCCLIWDQQALCYKICCRKYCVENPLQCGQNDGITATWDENTMTYTLSRSGSNPPSDVWQIDIPLSLAGTTIDPDNFSPSTYGISPGELIVVSVKYIDPSGCTRVCCKELCSSGPDDCHTQCYDNCCTEGDLQWLEDLKSELNIFCIDNPTCDQEIIQADYEGRCVYVLPIDCALPDLPVHVVDCSGVTIFTYSPFDFEGLEEAEKLIEKRRIWSCSQGPEPMCFEPLCDYEEELYCEYFNGFNVGDDVSNSTLWSTPLGKVPCKIAADANGEKYLDIRPQSNCGGILALADNSSPDATIVLTYEFLFGSDDGIQSQVNSQSNTEFVSLNIANYDIGEGYNLQVSDKFIGEPTKFSFRHDQKTVVRFYLNKATGNLKITIDDLLISNVNNTGITTFSDFFVDDAFSVTSPVKLYDICLTTCESCEETFTYDSETFVDCSDIAITGNTPLNNSSVEISYEYNGTSGSDPLFSVYQVDENTNQTSLVTNSTTFTAFYGRSYICCYSYIGANGCREYCCKWIHVDPPQDAVVFNIGEQCGPVSSIISVPITVQQFDNVGIFGFELHTAVTDDIEFKGIANVDSRLIGLSNNSINVFDHRIIIGWENGQGNNISIEDNAVIFDILVEIKNNFTGEIAITGSNVEVFGSGPLSGIINSGSLCVSEEYSIAGAIFTETGVFKNGIKVNLTGNQTDQTLTSEGGKYDFVDLTQANYTVRPHNNDNLRNGVSIIDVGLIRRHFLEKGELSTDYKKIAGDVDKSGNISIIDVGLARRIYLEKITTLTTNTSWRYVPANLDISSNPLDVNLADELSYSPLMSTVTDANFIAVKVGDVNDSASAKTKVNYDSRKATLNFAVRDTAIQSGETVTLPIVTDGFENVSVFGFEVMWDAELLTLQSVDTDNIPNFTGANYTIQEGRLILGWDDVNAAGISLTDGPALSLTFAVAADVTATTDITFGMLEAVDGEFLPLEVKGSTGVIEIGSTAVHDELSEQISLYPNPFSGELSIKLGGNLSNSNTSVSVYDIDGKSMGDIPLQSSSDDVLTISSEVFTYSGVYIIRITSEDRSFAYKVVRM